MSDLLILRLVQTANPPVKGLWVYVRPGTKLANVDAAVHHWSMQRWAARAEESAYDWELTPNEGDDE